MYLFLATQKGKVSSSWVFFTNWTLGTVLIGTVPRFTVRLAAHVSSGIYIMPYLTVSQMPAAITPG